MQIPRQFQQIIRNSFDFIFPPRCAGCGRVDATWCETCQSELAAIPVLSETISLEHFAGVMASGKHQGRLQDAVRALKYLNTTDVADKLGDRLATCLKQSGWQPDIIVPVPLHADRLRSRGYNQAEKIADALAHHSAIPCIPDASHRERQTRSQVGLNREERLQNVESAFSADTAIVSGKTILIVDDVKTTGATLIGCAIALKAAGATTIYALTVTEAV